MAMFTKKHNYIYSFIHVADAFIQSNVHCIQDIVFINAFFENQILDLEVASTLQYCSRMKIDCVIFL